VQDHRVAGDQLLAFQTVDHVAGGFGEVQLGSRSTALAIICIDPNTLILASLALNRNPTAR
jgi:hypothetical protein